MRLRNAVIAMLLVATGFAAGYVTGRQYSTNPRIVTWKAWDLDDDKAIVKGPTTSTADKPWCPPGIECTGGTASTGDSHEK